MSRTLLLLITLVNPSLETYADTDSLPKPLLIERFKNISAQNMMCNIRYEKSDDLFNMKACLDQTQQDYDLLIKKIRYSSNYVNKKDWEKFNIDALSSLNSCRDFLVNIGINQILQSQYQSCSLTYYQQLSYKALDLMP